MNLIIQILYKLQLKIRNHWASLLIDLAMWLLFILSVVAILHKVGLIDAFLGCSPNADTINEVFHNLSYSYLAGLMFYLINDWMPRQVREYNSRSALSVEINQLKSVLDKIHRIIVRVERKTSKDVVKPSDTKGQKMFTGIIWSKYSSPCAKPIVLQIDVEKHLQQYSQEAISCLDAIMQSPLFLDLNRGLANTYIHLRRDPFINCFVEASNSEPSADGFKQLYGMLDEKMYIKTDDAKISEPTTHERMNSEANKLM